MSIDRTIITGIFGWLIMALVRLIIQDYEDVDPGGRQLAALNELILDFVPSALLFFVLGVLLYIRLRRQSQIPIDDDVMEVFRDGLKVNDMNFVSTAIVMGEKQRLETARLAAAIRKDAEIEREADA